MIVLIRKRGYEIVMHFNCHKQTVSTNTANSTHNTKAKDFSKFIKNNKKLVYHLRKYLECLFSAS